VLLGELEIPERGGFEFCPRRQRREAEAHSELTLETTTRGKGEKRRGPLGQKTTGSTRAAEFVGHTVFPVPQNSIKRTEVAEAKKGGKGVRKKDKHYRGKQSKQIPWNGGQGNKACKMILSLLPLHVPKSF